VGSYVYALTLILWKVSRLATRSEMMAPAEMMVPTEMMAPAEMMVPTEMFPLVIDFDVGRSGGGYVVAVLVYAIGCCYVICAMG